jgi:hypothetical protein
MIAAGACVPFPMPRPKATAYRTRGRVVDARAGGPIAGAKIYYEGRNDLVFYSDAGGRFDIPEQNDLVLLTVVTIDPTYEYPRPHPMPRAVVVAKPGYLARRILLQPYYLQKWREQRPPYFGPAFVVDLGEVQMVATGEDGWHSSLPMPGSRPVFDRRRLSGLAGL